MTQGAAVFSKPSLVRTFVIAIGAIAVLFFIDTFLARMERSESRIEAERFYATGQRLMKQGLGESAADQFRAALSSAGENQEYQMALSQALMAAGRFPEAEATLADLLQRNGTQGAPNLAMARVLAKEGRIPEALSYYHRAIYGQWKQNALKDRVQVRFELVDLLVSTHEKEGLLAELLPLQEEAPDDSETKMKLGRLFTAAGSPARGLELFRDVLRKQPQDADAYAGLGEAEFARANYRTALNHFQMALRFSPEDQQARQRIELCNQILELDPSQRGLSIQGQFQRSVTLLGLVADDVRQCLGTAVPSPVQNMINAAMDRLKQRVAPSRQSAAYESNLDLADKLWQARKTECTGSSHKPAEFLGMVMDRLAQ